MTNLPAIARYYKTIKGSHSYSMHWSAGLKILVSAVRFRLRAPIKTLVYQTITVKNIIFLLLFLCLFFLGVWRG